MNPKCIIINGVPTLGPEDINELTDFQIIDVRRTEEFNAELGHLKGAKLVTLGPELNEFFKQTHNGQRIIFVCRSGVRSAQATQEALVAGFTEVYNMEGGMLKWNSLGLSVER